MHTVHGQNFSTGARWYNRRVRIDLFTIFPNICTAYLDESILKRAREMNALQVDVHDLRKFATDKHHSTDDEPYGGGGGMVMKPEPIFAAVEAVLGERQAETPVILLTPQGRSFTQSVARELAGKERLALIAGRYEGVDERVRSHLATDELSIGDFVLTGGELPALSVIDAVTRLLPGVLGDPFAASDDSHGAAGLLEYPHYTRPADFRDLQVPEVLLSGNHARIARWRREESLRRTWLRRPDLLLAAELSDEDRHFLAVLAEESTRIRIEQGE